MCSSLSLRKRCFTGMNGAAKANIVLAQQFSCWWSYDVWVLVSMHLVLSVKGRRGSRHAILKHND
jgi:hypothetical protein